MFISFYTKTDFATTIKLCNSLWSKCDHTACSTVQGSYNYLPSKTFTYLFNNICNFGQQILTQFSQQWDTKRGKYKPQQCQK